MGGLGAPELILMFFVAVLTLAPAIMGSIIGGRRTIGSFGGFLLGFFLSLLGVLIVYFLPNLDEPARYNFPGPTPADELKKYKELLDSGAITEQEYQAQKAKILNR